MFDPETVPCEICGRASSPIDKRCDNCWEVERRLASYIKSPAGRAWVEALLNPSAPPSDGSKVYVIYYREEVVAGRAEKIAAIYNDKAAAHARVVEICATPESRRAFFDTFGWPQPASICIDNFTVEAYPLKRGAALLDDWHRTEDGKYHPGWDHEAVLRDNEVTVTWDHQMVDGEGTVSETPPELCGWGLSWKYGCIHIGQTTKTIARKAAAVFVRLWQMGVAASFADKLMNGYIHHLELQENKRLTFLAEIARNPNGVFSGILLTREGMFERASLDHWVTQMRIAKALEPVPTPADEEVIVTFTKRKKNFAPAATPATETP